MPEYRIRVAETVSQFVDYTITAASLAQAKEKALIGDNDMEDPTGEIEVINREFIRVLPKPRRSV